eukprot:TRINITY_DN5129_c0_g1_i1.p1 TRINITY_DN5129_c0_g1~~TRINITY_DN5129_c0_g1_i1.p1  ORF type:complete len:999 (+),score=217.50 TRINITY_DN5129_c0_g1_i1:74-2998(+)
MALADPEAECSLAASLGHGADERTALLGDRSHVIAEGSRWRRPLAGVRAVLMYAVAVAALYIMFVLDTSSAHLAPSGVQHARAHADARRAAAGQTPCEQHLAERCGAVPPGEACRQCAYDDHDLNPKHSDCEEWDIAAFCHPGVPAEALAPLKQEESLEPMNAADFILDSFAICRMYSFAIGPSYLLLLRAGLTAMALAWLSILPPPVGSGEPSVPGALAVVTGLLLVGRSLVDSVRILAFSPVPSFVDSWYLWYELKWYIALQHPSFGQACSVVLHKFYGWISTELAWRRKVAEFKRKREEDALLPGAKGPATVPFRQVSPQQPDTRQGDGSGALPSGGGGAAPAAPAAVASAVEDSPRSPIPAQKAPQKPPSLPPQPPGAGVVQVLFDVAEALKSPPEAALGTWATFALQSSLTLALVNMSLVVLPLSLTHLAPAVLLLPSILMVVVFSLDWWRAASLTFLDCVLAALFLCAAGWVTAFLKQHAAWCIAPYETADKNVRSKANVISDRLAQFGIVGLHPHHPLMFAARAVFVKALSLIAALIVIALQEAAARVILLRQRGQARFLTSSGIMLCSVAFYICGGHRGKSKAVVSLISVCGCALMLAPLEHSPAEIFDARTTCAYVECAMRDFKQGAVGTLSSYFELVPFITALVHHVSPVRCFDSMTYKPPHWGAVGVAILCLVVLASFGYVVKRLMVRCGLGGDDALLEAMADTAGPRVRELCEKYPTINPARVAAVVRCQPDDRAEQSKELERILQIPSVHYYAGNDNGIRPVKLRAGRRVEVPPFYSPPPPRPGGAEGLINIAAESLGATVQASSNLWGSGLAAKEKLRNVIRNGHEAGEPYYLRNEHDNSTDHAFIFRPEPPAQLILDFGTLCEVHSIAVLQRDDRYMAFAKVETSVGEMGFGEEYGEALQPVGYREYAMQRPMPRDDKWVSWEKAPPVRCRYVRFTTQGKQYDGGARFERVWVWGRPVG